ncbi:MAG: hypothetical protein M3O09_14055 [Acidobacteriota bacterium]|nr:hypothetical protein [Acidobacteriota bacterium]
MKLTTGILIFGIAAGSAWAQNPNIIGIERNKLNSMQQQKVADSNDALGITPANTASAPKVTSSTPAKPAAGTPAATPKSGSPFSTAKIAPASPVKQSPKTKAVIVPAKTTLVSVAPTAAPPKLASKPAAAAKPVATEKIPAPKSSGPVAVEDKQNPQDPKKTPVKFSMTGKRDPFMSPVVNSSSIGSGCSSGKRCLSIEQIALKGVVKGDSGMIAVVVNALDKAYFLRENDPVFNGYVVKITGDSIVFKQSVQDRLGKTFTREVTKKISTPAV